jgi:hypothetical protein
MALIILLRKTTRQMGESSAVVTNMLQTEALTRGMKHVSEARGKEVSFSTTTRYLQNLYTAYDYYV